MAAKNATPHKPALSECAASSGVPGRGFGDSERIQKISGSLPRLPSPHTRVSLFDIEYRVPRALRIHVPGGFYHVTIRGNHQQRIFVSDGDQRLLNLIVSRALQTYGAQLHAYCWMSNHLHLVMQVGKMPLSNPMRNIASEFAREMQRKLATTGHFFERRYYARLVDTDSYLLELIRYIHLNPVRANIVDRAGRYPWSSHHAYVGARDEPWVTTDFALGMLSSERGRAIGAYLRFIQDASAKTWSLDHMEQASTRELKGVDRFQPDTRLRKAGITLDELIAQACQAFMLTRDLLESRARDPMIGRARAWVVHQAIKRDICGLSEVARALRRDESTLRGVLRTYAGEIE